MVATVEVQEGNGDPVTWTTITSARLCTSDTYNPGTNYPIPIPTSGFNYSYWKHIRLYFSGTFTQISNIRFYSDGSIDWTFGTNGELRRGNRDTAPHGCPEANYQQATGTEGTTGYAIEDTTNGHAYYNGQTTPTANVANDTSASPALIDDNTYTAAGGSYAVVLQVKVDTDATQGQQSAETLTFLYDEI